MVSVLCEPGTESAGRAISRAIQNRYALPSPPEILQFEGTDARPPEWDDVLLVVYRSRTVSQWTGDFIASYRDARSVRDPRTGQPRPGGFVVPIAMSTPGPPPEPISGIKAIVSDGSGAANAQVANAVGVFLGLALRPRDHTLFISYRSSDGTAIARDLHQRLLSAGFDPWLDDVPDNLPPGTDVQDRIRTRIEAAAMVLVVDTPDAAGSDWMREEIDVANGHLVPVLPVVVGPPDVSRFISLRALQRRAPVKPHGIDTRPLSDAEWDRVRDEIDELLLSAYRRRLRIVSTAERVFTRHGFSWATVDAPRRMYEAQRPLPAMPATLVLSHCSVHDPDYLPALRSYTTFLAHFPGIARVTHKLCVYDRDTSLQDAEIRDIDRELDGLPFILAHHGELGVLLLSNFARRR